MWTCEDVDCRSAGVKVWRCRSADVKVWRCRSADVKVWRRRSADVLQRLLFYEEPFAGALGNKSTGHFSARGLVNLRHLPVTPHKNPPADASAHELRGRRRDCHTSHAKATSASFRIRKRNACHTEMRWQRCMWQSCPWKSYVWQGSVWQRCAWQSCVLQSCVYNGRGEEEAGGGRRRRRRWPGAEQAGTQEPRTMMWRTIFAAHRHAKWRI